MTTPAPSRRAGAAAIARQGAAVALALLLVARPARAEVWNGRATAALSGTSAPSTSSRALQQTYEGGLRLEFTPVLDGNLQLRYDDTRGRLVTSGLAEQSTAQVIQPRLQLRFNNSPIDVTGGYDLSYARLRSETATTNVLGRTLVDRVHGAVRFSMPDYPTARLSVYRQATRNVESDAVVRDTSGQLSLDHSVGPVRLDQSTLYVTTTDTRSEVTTRTIQPRGSIAYDTRIGDNVTLGGSYNISYTDIAQTSLSGRTESSPVERSPSRGLYGVTDRPTNTTDRPLVPSPGLVDGDTGASAGISVGPEAVAFQNLGLDMGRLLPLDTLRVWLKTAGGFPVQYAGAITWSAFSSTDGVLWTPLATLSSLFDESFSRVDVTFPLTTARYFKLTTFGTNTTEAFVTELQGLEHVSVRPRATTRSSVLVQGLAATGTATVLPKLRVSTQAALSRASQGSPGGDFATTGWDLGGTVSAGPYFDRITATATQELRGSDTTQAGKRLGAQTGATLEYQVAEPVRLSAEGHRVVEQGTADRMQTQGGRVSAAVSLLPSTLDLAGSLGFDRVETLPDEVRTDRLSASASVSARLYSSVTLGGSATKQTGDVKQPLNAVLLFPQPPKSSIYSGNVVYRPNQRLSLLAGVSYVELDALSGVTQQYRVAWDPFPGGAFRLALSYDQGIDALNGSRLSRITILPRWQINRNMSLDGSYSDTLRSQPPPRSHTRIYYLAFTFRT